MRGKSNNLRGEHAEMLVRVRLLALGFGCVERVSTPIKVYRRGGAIIGATFRGQASGDFKAVQAGTGVAVLVEVKSRPARLRFSDLESHQRLALQRHHDIGGISLLAWVHRDGVSIMRWPLAGFSDGSSLTPEQAAAFAYKHKDGP